MKSIKPGRGPSMMGGLGSIFAGVFGVMFAAAGSLPVVLICFGISLIFFFVILSKKQIPKFSAVVVLIEAAVAYLFMR